MDSSSEESDIREDDRYPMSNEKLGHAYIFNHVTFDNDSLGVRFGTMKDCNDVEDAFRNLKFEVTIYNDLQYSEILQKMSNLSEMDYSNFDCLVIFVLTHGRNGKIFARDMEYYPEIYWKAFDGRNPSLALKPKLIFIQGNRGDEVDDGVAMVQPDGSTPVTHSIPNVPDVLLMYSCYDGFYSWRSTVTGSWFIQCLCKELKLRAKKCDLLTLLTFLNRRMLMRYPSSIPYNKALQVRNQVVTVVSTLTRILYLFPPNK